LDYLPRCLLRLTLWADGNQVRTKVGQWLSRHVRRPSLAGRGLPERMRSTTFALLGITAAAGLGLVAIFSQQSWPLLSPDPLPSAPAGSEAVHEAMIVERPIGGAGAGDSRMRPGPAPAAPHSSQAPVVESTDVATGLPLSPPRSEGSDGAPSTRQTKPRQPPPEPAPEPSVAVAPAPAPASPAPVTAAPPGKPSKASVETPEEAPEPVEPPDEDDYESPDESSGNGYGWGHGHSYGHSSWHHDD
jgi:outer membrane biosynthesis protein TonB